MSARAGRTRNRASRPSSPWRAPSGRGPAGAAPLAHREVLPNGIVLLVAERPAVPIVAVRLLTRAGAVFDPDDRAGLAHLTGALLTRGTAKRTGPEIDSAIEFVGGASRPAPGATASRWRCPCRRTTSRSDSISCRRSC